MAPLTDGEWEELARDLAKRVDAVAPGWTDLNESDPGMTFADLMAFLAESLLHRTAPSPRALRRFRDVARNLETVQRLPCRDPAKLSRVRYFHGRLLSAADLELEQAYIRGKQRRHNLQLHGVGVVRGLAVSVEAEPGREPVVAVSPGLAIGPDGEELLLCERTTSPLKPAQSPSYITLRLVDRLLDMVPTPQGEEASRIEEGVEIDVVPDVPESHLALARIERTNRIWRLDPSFMAPALDR